MAKKKHNLLLWGGGAAAAYYLWKNHQNLQTQIPITTTDPTTGTTTVSTGTPAAVTPIQYVSAPTQPVILPSTTGPLQYATAMPQVSAGLPSTTVSTPYGTVTTSNFSTPDSGPVATCMNRRPAWSQGQCEQTLANLVATYNAGIYPADEQANIDYHTLTNAWIGAHLTAPVVTPPVAPVPTTTTTRTATIQDFLNSNLDILAYFNRGEAATMNDFLAANQDIVNAYNSAAAQAKAGNKDAIKSLSEKGITDVTSYATWHLKQYGTEGRKNVPGTLVPLPQLAYYSSQGVVDLPSYAQWHLNHFGAEGRKNIPGTPFQA